MTVRLAAPAVPGIEDTGCGDETESFILDSEAEATLLMFESELDAPGVAGTLGFAEAPDDFDSFSSSSCLFGLKACLTYEKPSPRPVGSATPFICNKHLPFFILFDE